MEQVFLSGSNRPFTVVLLVPNLTELAARLEQGPSILHLWIEFLYIFIGGYLLDAASVKDPQLSALLRTAPSDQAAFDMLFARKDVQELFNQQVGAGK